MATSIHPNRTRAHKNREMLIRTLADAIQRAEELAFTDDSFWPVVSQTREAWFTAIERHRELSKAERDAYYAGRAAALCEVEG